MKFWLTRREVISGVALLLWFGTAAGQDARGNLASPAGAQSAIVAKHGLVVAQETRSARIGADVLARGGNAIDAAVATAFAMAVTYPRAGNLGGGGFMLIHLAARNEDIAIDYRETAPAAATRDMFLGSDGKPDPQKSRASALGIGVPGTVAGLALALAQYGSGKFSLADLIAPAIQLARDGLPVEDDTADTLGEATKQFAAWPASAKIFLHEDGSALREGDVLLQRDLAATLQAIAERGPRGFYDGDVAQKLVLAIRAAGGIMSLDDLKSYHSVLRSAVHGTYRGYDIVSVPLPSSGGTVLIETLNILENFDLKAMGADSVDAAHVLVEAMKRAYADRARYLGDPAIAETPLRRLLSKSYAQHLARSIDLQHATPAAAIAPIADQYREGQNTTHFSVVDQFGNAVSNTYTLNFSYGLGMVADGTGVLLNNELDDFTAAVGTSNAFGLIGYEANLPGPNKRPLSSMTPTIVLKDGRPWLVTGTPGGSRIISAVTQIVVDVIDYGLDLASAVARPRLHHQWLPDDVRVEHGFPPAVVDGLRARGHIVNEPLGQTSANSILVTPDGFVGAPDQRTRGAMAAGY